MGPNLKKIINDHGLVLETQEYIYNYFQQFKLKLNEVVTTIPTIGFNVEEIQFHNLSMTVWDVGGQKAVR